MKNDISIRPGKRFVASYSGGKDSVFAIYRAISGGMLPHRLITTYNTDMARSWFHGIPGDVLSAVSKSLGIEIELIRTSGKEYGASFEAALVRACSEGAEVCVFGDIDIEAHLEWCSERCAIAGVAPCLPLWGGERKALVLEFLAAGFMTVITTVDTTRMPESYLGKTLSPEIVDELEAAGIDACGENGEFHTFTFDGPIFKEPVLPMFGAPIRRDKYSTLPMERA